MLESPHRTVGLRPKDPVHLEPLAGVARQVTELELLLNAANGVAVAAFLDLDEKSRPRVRTDAAVRGQAMACLESLHGGLGSWTEHAIDHDTVPARPQQILEGLYWVAVVAVLDHWPRADAVGHDVLPPEQALSARWTEPQEKGAARSCAGQRPFVARVGWLGLRICSVGRRRTKRKARCLHDSVKSNSGVLACSG